MPYQIKKLSNGKYQVKDIKNNVIHAKGTTFLKATKQVKLLHMIDAKKKMK